MDNQPPKGGKEDLMDVSQTANANTETATLVPKVDVRAVLNGGRFHPEITRQAAADKGRKADVSEVGAQVLSVAEALRLTDQQRTFAEALAVDPEKNQSRAAVAAGVAQERAAIQGSRWARLGKVRAYYAVLTEKAQQLVVQRTGKRIADLAEWLEFLTEVKSARVGDYIDDQGYPDVEKIRNAPPGIIRKVKTKHRSSKDVEETEGEVELESAVTAAGIAIRHFDGIEVEKQMGGALANAFRQLPPETIAAVARAVLAGDRQVVEVQAKVVR